MQQAQDVALQPVAACRRVRNALPSNSATTNTVRVLDIPEPADSSAMALLNQCNERNCANATRARRHAHTRPRRSPNTHPSPCFGPATRLALGSALLLPLLLLRQEGQGAEDLPQPRATALERGRDTQ